MSDLLSELVSEFRGDYPDVPFAPGVDAAAFKAEEKPFFVTLKIGKVGAKSLNTGKLFSRDDVLRVVQEVNGKRPEGNLGHVPKEKRSTEYGLPKLEWVGALLDDTTGIAWGKAFVPNYAADVREFFMNKIRTNGRVGTSIYGVQGQRGLADMTLESIDIGHPDRVSVPDATTIPKITSEISMGGEKPVSDDIKIVSELLTGQLQEKTNLIAEFQTSKKGLEMQVADLTKQVGDAAPVVKLVAEIRTTIGADEKADVVKLISEMRTELDTLRKAKADGERDKLIAKFVTFEALRPTIALHMLAEAAGEEGIKKAVAELMVRPDIKLIADALKIAKGGPVVTVAEMLGEGETGLVATFKDTPEARAAAQRRTGIG